jgi:hypothetical protein
MPCNEHCIMARRARGDFIYEDRLFDKWGVSRRSCWSTPFTASQLLVFQAEIEERTRARITTKQIEKKETEPEEAQPVIEQAGLRRRPIVADTGSSGT